MCAPLWAAIGLNALHIAALSCCAPICLFFCSGTHLTALEYVCHRNTED